MLDAIEKSKYNIYMGISSHCVHSVEHIEIEESQGCVIITITSKKEHWTQAITAESKLQIMAFKSPDVEHIGMVWKERTPE